MSTETEATPTAPADSAHLTERFVLKAFVESCLVLEEGVATTRDIDLGMMMGTGMIPPPFARADEHGLDDVLAALEKAEQDWGEHFEPPLTLRRLVAQGRLGKKSGQGFFPYPRPDEGFEQGGAVQLETRGHTAIAWLNNPPANSISPELIAELKKVWEHVESTEEIRALIIASANPMLFCAGADIKAFTKMDAEGGKALLDSCHALLRSMERSRTVTIAAVNGLAFGGGCELAMACDFRLAAESATFGQPEINLGIIPGFGGTQRLSRLAGPAKALQMNLSGEAIASDDAYEFGIVHDVLPDHELFDAALHLARDMARKAPLAVEQIKQVSHKGDLDEGIEAEKQGFATVFASEDAKEGIGAFLAKRTATFRGK